MERHLELHETQELYQVGIDAGQLEREPIVLEKDGAPIGVVISYVEFQAYQKWKSHTSAVSLRPFAQKTPDAYLPSQTFLDDQEMFQRMLPDLMKTHKDKYVAIYHEELIDTADTLGELAKQVYARFGYQEIYMDQVAEPRVYRIPSVRVVRE